jgi:hypothetical protein
MDPAQITSTLQAMAAEHPAAHPYTLALLLESRCGVQISGEHAKELLAAPSKSRE